MKPKALAETVEAAVVALQAAETALQAAHAQVLKQAEAEAEARDRVAKSVAGLRIEPAWAECRAVAGTGKYATLEMRLMQTSSGKTVVEWKYYDEVIGRHIESPSLKSLMDKVRDAKTPPPPADTLADVVEVIEDDLPF